MILSFLVNITTIALNFFLNLLPVASSSVLEALNSGLFGFRSMLASANWIFPVQSFLSFLGIIFFMELGFFSYKLIKWLTALFSVGAIND